MHHRRMFVHSNAISLFHLVEYTLIIIIIIMEQCSSSLNYLAKLHHHHRHPNDLLHLNELRLRFLSVLYVCDVQKKVTQKLGIVRSLSLSLCLLNTGARAKIHWHSTEVSNVCMRLHVWAMSNALNVCV